MLSHLTDEKLKLTLSNLKKVSKQVGGWLVSEFRYLWLQSQVVSITLIASHVRPTETIRCFIKSPVHHLITLLLVENGFGARLSAELGMKQLTRRPETAVFTRSVCRHLGTRTLGEFLPSPDKNGLLLPNSLRSQCSLYWIQALLLGAWEFGAR